jgi:hypothetical protein
VIAVKDPHLAKLDTGTRSYSGGRTGLLVVTARVLFLSIVALEAAHTVTAILLQRAPSGHDGFQYFALQYFFLNNAIQAHEIAQWIPYMSQGTVATLWYGIQGSFLQTVLLHVPALTGGANLLSIYHVGVFVDEVILLTGTWLLARRFFDVPTTFFVAVSVVASAVWLDQPYWNFRLYYSIPLVLELGHRFLDTGRWRWAFLTCNLLALQTIGNLPYVIPLTSFVVFAYFGFYTTTHRTFVRGWLRSLRWDARAMAALAGSALSFAAAYTCVTLGTEQLVNYNVGRSPSGTTSLSYFLSYGRFTDLGKWNDVVLRLSPALDNTLYAGMLLAPLLLIAFTVVDRRRLHLVLTAVILLLFTLATPIARLVFYAWPGMWYFRHIGLVSSLVKVLFCFIAGIGFEFLFRSGPSSKRRTVRTVGVLSATGLALCALWALNTAASPAALDRYVAGITVDEAARSVHVFDRDELGRRMRLAAGWAVAGAVIVGLVPVLLTARQLTTHRLRDVALYGVLAFVVIDLYHFKFTYLFDRSDGIGPGQRYVVTSSPMPYPHRRVSDLRQALAEEQSRLVGTIGFNQLLRQLFEGRREHGSQYWTSNAFWFIDEINTTLQADSWLAPLDQFARMFHDGTGVDFPVEREAAAKLGGLRADKIRFFARAFSVASVTDVKPLLTDDSYKGDLLFVSGPEGNGEQTTTVPWGSQHSLSADDSRQLPYRVERFDANNLVVRVSNPDPTPMWMFYSDVWHPWWRATVNGLPAPVYRANVAYKAVRIQPGENTVHFRFTSVFLAALAALDAVNAGLWLIAAGAMTIGVLKSSDR